jgi:hypothetical protein
MPELTGRQVALVIAGALAVITLAVGGYGLVTGPRHERPGTASDPLRLPSAGAPATRTPDRAALTGDPNTRFLPRTNDAVAYARAVATALFDWDTSAGYLPADYQAPVLADADPSGEETPGLIDDVGTYLPTVSQWLDLATMDVVQALTIDSVQVPADWQRIVNHAHGELRPGTKAVTITGTRHRTGIWDSEHTATTSPVAFTVFVACRPAFGRCHVLRLSQLGNPLR